MDATPSPSNLPTIAFFGATGGCTNACLVHTLNAGYNATALARTPSKLTKQLQDQGIDDKCIASQMSIIEGDATDIRSVKAVLEPQLNKSHRAPVIVLGVGGTPQLQASLFTPLTLDSPHICENATVTILKALDELYSTERNQSRRVQGPRPVVCFISTTGISKVGNDVPFLFRFLYHWLLAIPHADKRRMEELFVEQMARPEPLISGMIGVRPSLLLGTVSANDAYGMQAVRAGRENAPAVGYTIKRADVGKWIFEHIVQSEEGHSHWMGQMVTLTY